MEKGSKHTEATKKRMSEAHKGNDHARKHDFPAVVCHDLTGTVPACPRQTTCDQFAINSACTKDVEVRAICEQLGTRDLRAVVSASFTLAAKLAADVEEMRQADKADGSGLGLSSQTIRAMSELRQTLRMLHKMVSPTGPRTVVFDQRQQSVNLQVEQEVTELSEPFFAETMRAVAELRQAKSDAQRLAALRHLSQFAPKMALAALHDPNSI